MTKLLVEHCQSKQYYACDTLEQAEKIGGKGMFIVHGRKTAKELTEYNPIFVNT